MLRDSTKLSYLTRMGGGGALGGPINHCYIVQICQLKIPYIMVLQILYPQNQLSASHPPASRAHFPLLK